MAEPEQTRTVRLPTSATAGERVLVSAMGVSLLGTATTNVLLPLIALSAFDAGPAILGMLAASVALPGLVLRLPAGALADRSSRKIPTLAIADLARAMILGGLVAAWAAGFASAPMLIGAALAVGVLSVQHSAFMPAAIPTVVAPDRAASVNGRVGSLEAATDALGPSLASGLILIVAAPLALLFDVASYLISGIMKLSIRTTWTPDDAPAAEVGEAGDGPPTGRPMARLRLDPQLHPLLRRMIVIGLANGALTSLLLLFLTRELHLPPASYGLVLSVGAVGGVLGGMLAGPTIGRLGALATMRAACVLLGFSVALMPVAMLFGGIVIPMIADLVGSLGAVLVVVSAMTHIQTGRSEQIGRSVAVVMVVVEAGHVAGALLGGFLAQRSGVLVVLIGASVVAFGGALASLPMFWRLRAVQHAHDRSAGPA